MSDEVVLQAVVERARALAVIEHGAHRWKCVAVADLALLCAAAEENADLRAERDRAREDLAERKVIDRAKGILMAKLQLGEDAAYHLMRRIAMNQAKRLVDIARAIVATPSVDGLPRVSATLERS